MTLYNGSATYIGDFKDDKFHGEGEMVWLCG
jgi:hypothetical protein